MPKYALWIRGKRGPEFQVLHHNDSVPEHIRLQAIAPPVKIQVDLEDAPLHFLREWYPVPPYAPIAKSKKID